MGLYFDFLRDENSLQSDKVQKVNDFLCFLSHKFIFPTHSNGTRYLLECLAIICSYFVFVFYNKNESRLGVS